jgi:hypothetical protein
MNAPAPKVITPADVVAVYITTRDEIARLKKESKDAIDKLEELQTKREKWLQQQLDTAGQKSASTDNGTYFKKKNEFVSVSDMDKFVEFLYANKATDLLNKAVNKTAALARMGEDADNRDPSKVPGLKYTTEIEVQVNRPKTKA